MRSISFGCVMSAVAALLAFLVLKPVIHARLRPVQELATLSPEEAASLRGA